ncbi:AAA family ATPase [Butyricicoccus pullicaecorum]|uniref:AAA family ATPase n=1 Tax=Butyricicoccus pullicaecorum TaxID=501571 RepID=UPI0039908912
MKQEKQQIHHFLHFQEQDIIIECKMGPKGREMGMAKVLAFVNQKGGGENDLVVNLVAALQKAESASFCAILTRRPPATSGLGVEKSTAAHSTYDIVIEDFPAADAVIHTNTAMFCLNVALSGAGVELVGVEKREYALKTALQPLREQYDYIFIDCPPSLELLTLNALCAADQVLIPVQCEYYALEGLSDLMVMPRGQKRLNRRSPSLAFYLP